MTDCLERQTCWLPAPGFIEQIREGKWGCNGTARHCHATSNKIIYQSAVHPADDLHPNKHLLTDLGESLASNKPKPITFVKSKQDLDKSVSKPMAEYNPDDIIGRTFLLPPNQYGERHRASIKQKVMEISEKLDEHQNAVVDNINFLLDVRQGRSQAIISYNQDSQEDDSLHKF